MDKSIPQQERELSEYLTEWANTYYRNWNPFYHEVNQNKQSFRGQLSHANDLLNMLDTLIGNLEGHFELDKNDHLIPSSFASIDLYKTIRYELIATPAYLAKTNDKHILYLARSLKTRQSFLSIWEKLKDFCLPYNTGKS